MAINLPQKRIIWIFVCLFLLFAIPLTLATWMFIEGKPLISHTTNHGELIQPALEMSNLAVSEDQQIWKDHWLLLYVNPTHCEQICEKALYNMRQIRTATGKDADRVQRMILTFSELPTDTHLEQLLNTQYNGTLHLNVSAEAFAHFTQNNISAKAVRQTGGIYMVDPLGNVMMFYPQTTPPMDIFKDLTRLLKLSQIG